MNYSITLITVVIGLGMAAVAAHESEAAAEPTELQHRAHIPAEAAAIGAVLDGESLEQGEPS